MDKMPEINFGVSLDIDGQMFRLTGIGPSPRIQTPEDLANLILDFFNGHMGTSFQVKSKHLEDCDERKD